MNILPRLKEIYVKAPFLNRIRYAAAPFIFRRKKKRFLFDDSRFFRVNLGFGKKWFYGFVNIDRVRSGGRVLVCSYKRLPFSNQTVKSLQVDFGVFESERSLIHSHLAEWSRVLVPGGKLVIENAPSRSEGRETDPAVWVSDALYSTGFVPFGRTSWVWLSQPPCLGYKNQLSLQADLQTSPQGEKKGTVRLKKDAESSSFRLPFTNASFDALNAEGVLENLRLSQLEEVLSECQRVLKPTGTLEVVVPDENPAALQFFDKAFLAELFTEHRWTIEYLSRTAKELGRPQLKMRVRPKGGAAAARSSPELAGKRLLALGEYSSFRYTQLGFHWDGQARAFDELGIESVLMDVRRMKDPRVFVETARSFKPHYILLGLKECLPIILEYASDLRPIGAKILYWFCDPEHPAVLPLNGVVDCMFLSNRGQIPQYQKQYSLERVYYLPQACTPAFMHYEPQPECYDIGFAGAISKAGLHKSRSRLIEQLRSRYQVEVRSNVRNNIAAFYSQSKLAFGVSDFDAGLYTSNRFFIALGCGAVYVCRYFSGMERLAENKRHAVWFRQEDELWGLVERYLKSEEERKRIRQAAQQLAHERHTYVHRIQNMLDIAEGRTEKFYGFLNE